MDTHASDGSTRPSRDIRVAGNTPTPPAFGESAVPRDDNAPPDGGFHAGLVSKVLADAAAVGMLPVTIDDRRKGFLVLGYPRKTEWKQFMTEVGETVTKAGLVHVKTPTHIVRLCVLVGAALGDTLSLLQACSRKFESMKANVNSQLPPNMAENIMTQAIRKHAKYTFVRYCGMIAAMDRQAAKPLFDKALKKEVVNWLGLLETFISDAKHEHLRIREAFLAGLQQGLLLTHSTPRPLLPLPLAPLRQGQSHAD